MSPLILTGLDRELEYIIILEPQRTLINNTVREPQTEGGGGATGRRKRRGGLELERERV